MDPNLQEGVTQQVSLRTLVNDLIGLSPEPTNAMSLPQGTATITTKLIAKAIESSKRNIDRGLTLHNLELLLAREVEMGHFIRVSQDTYSVPPMQSPPPIIVHPNLPTTTSNNNAFGPTSSHQSLQGHHPHHSTLVTCNTVTSSPDTSLLVAKPVKSDEERKNDLIQEKLFKLSTDRSKSSSSSSMSSAGNKNEPFYLSFREKRKAVAMKKRNSENGDNAKVKKIKGNKVKKMKEQQVQGRRSLKKEEWQMGAQEGSANARPGSKREKVIRGNNLCIS